MKENTMKHRIKVDGVDYIREGRVLVDLGRRVVVLQRGWVVVGRVCREGPRIRVTDASVVRRWGTTKGLGELAEQGPRPNTVLDPCPPVEALESEVVLSMECGRGWS